MTPYQVMPPLTPAELQALYDDIEANGIRVPIDVDEWGNILDGHHRAEIAESLGIDFPIRELAGLTEAQKIAHAYAVNVTRRSLTQEQKRDLIAESLKREPELSDRAHAKRTGSSHPTVADVRDELEESGRLESFTSRKGADGRTRPSTQPTRPATWLCGICGAAFKTAHTHCETCGDHYPEPVHCPDHHDVVNIETGEIPDGPTLAGRAAADRAPLPRIFKTDAQHERERIAQQNGWIARALKHLGGIQDGRIRARLVAEWDPANCDDHPSTVTPSNMREIANGLLAFADEMEATRGLRVV